MPARPRVLRVMFFIDGQNLYHACAGHLDHGYCYPDLLAGELVQGRQLVEVRYYTGLHDPNVHPAAHAAVSRRLRAMRNRGIHVCTHPLKYPEQTEVDDSIPRAPTASAR